MYTKKEWQELGETAHELCFHEKRDYSLNTFDFALLVVDEDEKPVAYATILLMDSKTAYMQHGGAFPDATGTTKVARAYHLIMAYVKDTYMRITTRIRNVNVPMLKLALSAELIVNGIDIMEGETYLNLSWIRINGT